MTASIRSATLLLALLASCASSQEVPEAPPPVDGSLLAELDEAALAPVTLARAARDQALDERAKQRGELERATDAIELGQATQRVHEAELARAELAEAIARRSGTIEEHGRAGAALEVARARLEESRRAVVVLRRQRAVVECRAALAAEEYELCRADLELQKAVAVRALDRAAVEDLSLVPYREAVERVRERVEMARVERNQALRALEEAEEDLRGARIDLTRVLSRTGN